jgi:putative flippase GtrA
MPGNGDRRAPGDQHLLRHWLGFLISGGVAFTVDALVLELLTRVAGLHPIGARLIAISFAMVAGWLMHRSLTFAVPTPPSLTEFLRYASVAWTAAAVNYGLFVLILVVRPATPPLVALVVSSIAAMTLSYLGMRFAAFRPRAGGRGGD